MSTLGRDMFRYLQGKTAVTIAGGGDDGNGGGDHDSSYHKGKNTAASPDLKNEHIGKRHVSLFARKNCSYHCRRR
jgi:hypothetical protein